MVPQNVQTSPPPKNFGAGRTASLARHAPAFTPAGESVEQTQGINKAIHAPIIGNARLDCETLICGVCAQQFPGDADARKHS